MDIDVAPGLYVVAVSGGIDSMVLLDMLRQKPGVRLVVAHFDHGIRDDSHEDRRLVQDIARRHKLPFVYAKGNLGSHASEAAARTARYKFLEQTRAHAGARAIITAHHQDDAVETAILNMLRGGGRMGLTSMKSTDGVFRPLLKQTKYDLHQYAQNNGIQWREDSTNANQHYLRNYIRHQIVPRLSNEQYWQLVESIERMHELNREIDALLSHHLHVQPGHMQLDRGMFIKLPHAVSREVLAAWLRKHNINSYDRRTLERLVTAIKTLKPGRTVDVNRNFMLVLGQREVELIRR